MDPDRTERRGGSKKEKPRRCRDSFFLYWLREDSAGFRESALVTACRVAVNEAFAGGTVQQLHSLELGFRGGTSRLRLLEGSPARRALRAVPHLRGARLTHVLLRGSNIGHRILVQCSL